MQVQAFLGKRQQYLRLAPISSLVTRAFKGTRPPFRLAGRYRLPRIIASDAEGVSSCPRHPATEAMTIPASGVAQPAAVEALL
jgi:hypothetical protein